MDEDGDGNLADEIPIDEAWHFLEMVPRHIATGNSDRTFIIMRHLNI